MNLTLSSRESKEARDPPRTSTWNAAAPSSCWASRVASTRTRAATPRSATTLAPGEQPFVVDGVLVYVDDIDAHFQRAQASGATVLSSLEDNSEVGQRQYRAEDLEGNRWMFAQPI